MTVVSEAFADHVRELLSSLGQVRIRKMFGGAGVYLDELMFATIFDDGLYFRVDQETQARFREAGSTPALFRMKDGRELEMSYWSAPEEALESPDEAEPWARLALEAAMRSKAKKRK
jgi:DNA transformation protein